ncbi:PQQ-binding-like beta-propeller repeat protein [Gammaproteobacteria bacterium]|uniref:Pyrrolo-quinoline quinone n=1 Tax=OM182 bacterium MED-G28 TaxID=1986256 RepID=A0A2A5WAW8_9GAMM|nr:pyrrolo-quinoline quinone [Gammaproteobacteria bacterium]MDC0220267.1 PQQ-binding-like beta-propeller repeat protein [Gammaproteobacteria bacterium]PDH33454.1 MAG: pyrrolo-quinoline quinone [OM182 bacterium MED-G28]
MKKLTLEPRISSLLTSMLLSTLFLVPIASYSQAGEFPSVTDEMLQNPADSDWLMWRRTLDSWGYSPLDQVSRENVDELQLVWTRNLATGTGEITPLAYNGILFVPQANDIIEAIDAKTGDFIWQYRRDIPEDLYEMVGGNARNNRNLAIYEDRIINTSDDNYIFALDALTGNLEWETEILDYQVNSATHSSGPIIADGLAISGRSCRPWGGPNACVIVAHNASTGEEAWRRRLIPAPGEPGDETWGDVPFESRHHVGSWMVPSYDPELELIILGTSVTSPAPKFYLGGTDNKHLYHNSTLALDVATGEIRWYYQHMNDHWDLDHPFERLLVETRVAPDPDEVTWINPNLQIGETRKVITGIPGKTGIVYTLDRATGEFLWATPTVEQNVVIDIDGSTGEVTENPEVIFREAEQIVFVCPTWLGGKDWEAGAYSPITNVMYYPLRNTCANMLATGNFESDIARSLTEGGQGGLAIYSLAARHQITPGTENLGTVRAVSAETGRTEWLYETRAGTMSLVATGGGLIFGGDANGRFRAFDHESGEVLWEINLGSSVSGYPISFAVDGKQYIAVNTGGGQPNLTPELRPSRGTNLYVFALPD